MAGTAGTEYDVKKTVATSGVKYNETEARFYYQYARVSYCTKDHIEHWDCGDMCYSAGVAPGPVHVTEEKQWSWFQGYVARIPPSVDGKCVVAFRGLVTTLGEKDVALALKMVPWYSTTSWCRGCAVSAALSITWGNLRNGIFAGIRERQCQNVAFTGHSYGGALAAMAFLDVYNNMGLSVGPTYSFGMPRPGNQRFAEAYVRAAEKQGVTPPMWRLVHYLDPIPRMIPRLAQYLGEYTHIPLEVYYTDRKNVDWQVCPSSGVQENKTCSEVVPFASCSPPGSLDYHFDHERYLNATIGGYWLRNTTCQWYPGKPSQAILLM